MNKEDDLDREWQRVKELLGKLTPYQIMTAQKINLDLAGIFYVNAWLQIVEGERKFKKLKKEIKAYNNSFEKQVKNFPIESTEFVTFQLSKIRELEIHYEPVLRYFSTAKILLVCCAETFINEVSFVALNGRSLQEFDKLSIIGKWLLLQDILKIEEPLKINAQPLQDFSELVKERNKLVHFKGEKKKLDFKVPDYIYNLKLTDKDCRKNIESVKNLIINFSINWKGGNGPDWLYIDDKEIYRNPCFYIGNREWGSVLWSDNIDEK